MLLLYRNVTEFSREEEKIYGIKDRKKVFDFSKNEIKLGDATAPISITRGCLYITLIVDTCSIELFTDNGKIYVSCLDGYTLMDRNLPYIKINASTNIGLDSIEINTLKSIWD